MRLVRSQALDPTNVPRSESEPVMTSEQIYTLIRARPFLPFVMHMADGRSVRVTHPEAIAYAGGRTAAVATSQRTIEVIDLLLVPSRETEDVERSADSGSGEGPLVARG